MGKVSTSCTCAEKPSEKWCPVAVATAKRLARARYSALIGTSKSSDGRKVFGQVASEIAVRYAELGYRCG